MEIMVHPGSIDSRERPEVGNEELARYLASADRQRELQFCVDARRWMDMSRLTNFRRLAEPMTSA
jgi:hypothetical protein